MKITLLYYFAVFSLYQGKETKKYKELRLAKLPCYKYCLWEMCVIQGGPERMHTITNFKEIRPLYNQGSTVQTK